MKYKFYCCIFFTIFIFSDCKKKESTSSPAALPQISTSLIINITKNSAQGGGSITSEGTSAITAVGVCWSTSHDPTTLSMHTNDGAGTGTYQSALNNLIANTKYYVRAYATNSTGTAFGDELNFTTTIEPCDTITYNKHIKALMTTYCVNCHGDTPVQGAKSLTTYAQVKDDADQIKAYTVDGIPEIMPQGGAPLSKAEKDLIVCWLSNGKQE